ncbi:MAG TPA: SMI1/KNR4 family protein [Vicinamibacterales bacterium]|nr:SMI1/KNR4 family protein [Vicinamibacterales bacterium]
MEPTDRYRQVAALFRETATADEEHGLQPATMDDVTAAQDALSCRFPDSYVWLQLEFGDARNRLLDIYGVRRVQPPSVDIIGINLEERRDGRPALPAHLIAFSDSGGGDFCCFDTSALEDGECPVVWWDHEAGDDQQPEPAAPTFLDWIETELRERAAEEPGSLLDALPDIYRGWMREWFKKK